MIRLHRPVEPRILIRNKARWLTALLAAVTDADIKRAEGKYRKPAVKASLVTMCDGKCSYCESKILHIDYGDIEHFRPKANPLYRNLTFEWSNFLLSCKVCNGAGYKGTEFPDATVGGPPIDPSLEQPNEHLSFFFDPTTGIATVLARTERGRITRDLFGLNRPALRAQRSMFVKKLFTIARLAVGDVEAEALLVAAAAESGEFSAFARAFLP